MRLVVDEIALEQALLRPLSRMRRSSPHELIGFLAYGFGGWAVDSLFVAIHTGRRRRAAS